MIGLQFHDTLPVEHSRTFSVNPEITVASYILCTRYVYLSRNICLRLSNLPAPIHLHNLSTPREGNVFPRNFQLSALSSLPFI